MCVPNARPAKISRRAAMMGAVGVSVTAGLAAAPDARATAPVPGMTAIVGATVFDGHRSLGTGTVLLYGPHILAVGPDVTVPAGIEVRDGAGKTLLPGLIDAHVHAFGLSSDPVRFGVTTELDMFAFLETLGPYREQRESTAPTEFSDVWTAGTLATVPGGHGTQFGPIPTLAPDANEAAIEEFVDQRLVEGSDYLKVILDDGSLYGFNYPTLGPEQVAHLVAAAHDRNLRCIVHVSQQRDAGFALEAGADGLAHVPGDRAGGPVLEATAREGAFVTSTLSVYNAISCAGESRRLLEDPLIAPLLSAQQKEALTVGGFECQPEIFPAASDNIGSLHAAGVPILAGTDVGNAGVARGASLLSELGLLVDAGLSPVQALHSATGAPAEHFGLDDRGVLAPGRRADLVLVDGDATRDIRSVRAIDTIWRNGCPVDRSVRPPAGLDAES